MDKLISASGTGNQNDLNLSCPLRLYSGKPAVLLVGFVPGGMEELFYKYRTDQKELDRESYFAEAKAEHATEYQLGN